MTLVQKEPKSIKLWTTNIKKVYLGSNQVRPIIPPYLCFTANTAGSTIKLYYTWSTRTDNMQTSTDGSNWSAYTFNTVITLTNIWDKVYFRRNLDTPWKFSVNYQNRNYFVMTWSIAASGDITTLLCKEWTTDLTASWVYCFWYLFNNCTSLTTIPKLPAVTLTTNCYTWMFTWCTGLSGLPNLPATALAETCYSFMFNWCTSIKLSTTQGWEYQTEYRIPNIWTWTTAWNSLQNMFASTWWTFTWTPSINTTYYTSNTVV